MIYIRKNDSPAEFEQWKASHPGKHFKQIERNIKRKVRASILAEQGYVCCFCGSALGVQSSASEEYCQQTFDDNANHNVRLAHIIPKSKDPTKELDYTNICASCDSTKSCNINNECIDGGSEDPNHCDVSQRDNLLPIAPTMEDCLTYFSFGSDGTINPNPLKSEDEQEMAKKTIEILGLNCTILQVKRKNILKTFREEMKDIKDRKVLIQKLDNLNKKNRAGFYAPFYFVPLSYFSML